MRRLVAFVLGLCLLSTPVLAQAPVCSEVLGLVREVRDESYSNESTASFERFFCDQTFSSWQKATESATQVGIVIEGLPINFGTTSRDKNFGEYQRIVCDMVRSHHYINQDWRLHLETVNAQVVQAWSECIKNGNGLHFWLEVSEASTADVSVGVNYLTREEKNTRTLTTRKPLASPPSAAKCTGRFLKTEIFGGAQYADCTRLGSIQHGYPAVTFKIAVEGVGEMPIHLQAIPPAPRRAGTVEAETLVRKEGWVPGDHMAQNFGLTVQGGAMAGTFPNLRDATGYAGQTIFHKGSDERFVPPAKAHCLTNCEHVAGDGANTHAPSWGAKKSGEAENPNGIPDAYWVQVVHWKTEGGIPIWQAEIDTERFSREPLIFKNAPEPVSYGSLAFVRIPKDRVSSTITFKLKDPRSDADAPPINVIAGQPTQSPLVSFVTPVEDSSTTILVYRINPESVRSVAVAKK